MGTDVVVAAAAVMVVEEAVAVASAAAVRADPRNPSWSRKTMEAITLRFAVASEGHEGLQGRVGQHFGRCAAYTLVEVEDGRIGEARVVDNPFVAGHAPGDVPGFIASTDAHVLLTGGIGHRAISFFGQHGIEVSSGHTGTVAEAVEAWVAGIAGGPASCSGHEHEGGHDGCGPTQ